MPPEVQNLEELKDLLEENLEVAKDNNRLLRLIRRDATVGLIAKVVLWLILLGVPIFFLGAYLEPLMQAFTGATSSSQTAPMGVFGLPTEAQLQEAIDLYKGLQEGQ